MSRIATATGTTDGVAPQMDSPPRMKEGAFRSFYDATAPRLRAYLARTSGDDALADDLTQEAYLRLLRSDFEPHNEAHRKNYLYRIATNLLRDHYRGRKRRPEDPLDDHDSPVTAGDRTARSDLEHLLGRLRSRERQMLWLAYVEGCSHEEIAELLGLKAPSMRPMLFRARHRMANLCRAAGLAPAARRQEPAAKMCEDPGERR